MAFRHRLPDEAHGFEASAFFAYISNRVRFPGRICEVGAHGDP